MHFVLSSENSSSTCQLSIRDVSRVQKMEHRSRPFFQTTFDRHKASRRVSTTLKTPPLNCKSRPVVGRRSRRRVARVWRRRSRPTRGPAQAPCVAAASDSRAQRATTPERRTRGPRRLRDATLKTARARTNKIRISPTRLKSLVCDARLSEENTR